MQLSDIGQIVHDYWLEIPNHSSHILSDIPFGWQPRFYDRIIRNQPEMQRIEYYIQANPLNWNNDENFPA
jgi:hypothetical protein